MGNMRELATQMAAKYGDGATTEALRLSWSARREGRTADANAYLSAAIMACRAP